MRLDKYIKLTRLIKRREVAKVLIEEGSIKINDKIVKPSYEIKINDVIGMTLGHRYVKIKILSYKDNVSKIEAIKLYEILENSITTK